jgi:GNAT superfamily N-acetyltransferase
VIVVSPAQPSDVPALADLMQELDRFYGATEVDPLDQRSHQIASMLFGETPAAHVLLARDASELVGMAAYSYLWPAAGVTASLYLKELYVHQAHRGKGIGRALMQQLCAVAAKNGCSRVEWTTDNDNTSARRFYDALRAPVYPDKLLYRLEGENLQAMAQANGS